MRTSMFPLFTIKETPSESDIISSQLMLRAGLVRKLVSGIYTWLPLGLRILHKIEKIVREEMNNVNCIELLMPAIQPSELWNESGRWEQYGSELLRIHDRHNRTFCFAPTHEEVITDLFRREIKSYKQLPVTFYQIQTKFRDEIRPRFGLLRTREFLMKDAYSFDVDQDNLKKSYENIHNAYVRIFTRIGLNFRVVLADTGSIGGISSQEFHVLAENGEDTIAVSTGSSYAANIDVAEAISLPQEADSSNIEIEKITTPNFKNIDDLCNLLRISPCKVVKSFVVNSVDNTTPVLILIRGDHSLNLTKIEKLPIISKPLTLVKESIIKELFGVDSSFISPIGFKGAIIADRAVADVSKMLVSGNSNNCYLLGVKFGRDCQKPLIADIRNVVDGDPSPDGYGKLRIMRGIEVGHIFKLGTKYSVAMNAKIMNKNGTLTPVSMGCYGIGISRIVAATIEQNYDNFGIKWPVSVSPFHVALLPIGYNNSQLVKNTTEEIYKKLTTLGMDVLIEDRNISVGIMFTDMELIGIPYLVVISERNLLNKKVECKFRRENTSILVEVEKLQNYL